MAIRAYAEVMEQDGNNAHSTGRKQLASGAQPRMSPTTRRTLPPQVHQQTRTELDPDQGGQRRSPAQLPIQQLVISGESRRTRQNRAGAASQLTARLNRCGISKDGAFAA